MKWRYRVQWDRIPDYMREGVALYVENGILPGDFLRAIISNDLRGAAGRADHVNKHLLFDYAAFFHAFAPSPCWGSEERMVAWHKQRGLEGMEKADGRVDP